MKQIHFYLIGLLVLWFSSCAEEPLVNTSGQLRVWGGLATGSRTTLIQEGDVTHTHWVKGDLIGLHTEEEANLRYQAMNEGASTEFISLGKDLIPEEGKEVRAYYPYAAGGEEDILLPYTLSMTSTTPVPVFLYGTSTIEGNELNFSFKHLFAYLRITVSAQLFRDKLNSLENSHEFSMENCGIYLGSSEPISCPNALYNLKTGEITHGSDCMRIIYDCLDVDLTGDGTYTYMIPVLPQTSGAVAVYLYFRKKVSDGYLYPVRLESKRIPSDGIQAGHVYRLNYGEKLHEDENQVALLESLYQATRGDQWVNKANWLSDRSLNEWFGVNTGTANYNYVHSLDLPNNNLTGSLPEDFAQLMDRAESINLEGNLLTGDIPESVRSHPNWSKIGWGIIHQDFDHGGGFDISHSNIYAEDTSAVELLSGASQPLKELFAKNKLTQVITIEPDQNTALRNFDALKVNQHLDYQPLGLETVVFTGADKDGNHLGLVTAIKYNYTDVAGLKWMYGCQKGKIGYSYFYDSNGQLVYIAPFRPGRDNTAVKDALDKFLISYLGNPVYHKAYNMPYYTSSDYSSDGEVYLIQEATEGNGIDIVLIGEGFTDRHMDYGGLYEQRMQEATELIFSLEPYKSLRNRFNVFVVKVVSPNEEFTYNSVNAINEMPGVALSYASLTGTACPLVAVIYNTEKYVERSYCNMMYDGSCVAYSMDKLDTTLLHELCGHGIAWLADEYIESGYAKVTLPDSEKEVLDVYAEHLWGLFRNVDYRNDPGTVRWAHFLSDSRYASENLGIYEGAYLYGLGAYRSSDDSMMRGNIPYFNAPSREMIYKSVMTRSEGSRFTYDYETFVQFDEAARKQYAESRGAHAALSEEEVRRIQERHRPPVVLSGTWRDVVKRNGNIRVPLR